MLRNTAAPIIIPLIFIIIKINIKIAVVLLIWKDTMLL